MTRWPGQQEETFKRDSQEIKKLRDTEIQLRQERRKLHDDRDALQAGKERMRDEIRKQEREEAERKARERHEAELPIVMFSGGFAHQSDDLHVNGAGIDFIFRRTYRNQSILFGPLGANWDHVYDLRLVESGDVLRLKAGDLREHVYEVIRRPLRFGPPVGTAAGNP